MGSVFFEITILLCVAAVLSLIFRYFKQPGILAYILTGILVGPFGQLQFQNHQDVRTFAQLGVTLLLFTIGLELKFSQLRSLGTYILLIGTAQILVTFGIAFGIATMLGFSQLSSLYIGAALSFSSTIIIVKIFSDTKELASLHGKIAVGVLLLQDFFAILILVALSGFGKEIAAIPTTSLIIVLLKVVAVFGLVVYLSNTVLPIAVRLVARSEESLFLFSLAWVLSIAALTSSPLIGFPIEIGGFLAGLALANTNENIQIAAKVRGLRDFFITIFFVVLGMDMSFVSLQSLLTAAILLTLFVLFGKPLITFMIMSIVGYRKRTSFLTGITAGQISEFSLIIILLGNKLGHVPHEVVSLVTIIGIASFAVSVYVIIKGKFLYAFVYRYLAIFERKNTHLEKNMLQSETLDQLENHVMLIGAHRMGRSILSALMDEKEKVIVVDFDPDIIKELNDKGVLSIFGDIADEEVQQKARLHKAKVIISTVPDLEDNLMLLHGLRKAKNGAKVVVIAQDENEAKRLYKSGADYVVLPHLMGGRHLANIIKSDALGKIDEIKKKDLNYLN